MLSRRTNFGDNLNWLSPINWDCPLNNELVSRWMVLQGQPGWKSSRLLALVDPLYGHTGTLTNMVPATAWTGARGRPGGFGSLEFGGLNQVVTTTLTKSVIPTTADVAIMAWVYSSNTGVDDEWFLISNLTDAAPNFHNVSLSKAATGKFYFNNYDGSEHRAIADIATENQWVHVAGVRRSSVNYIYINGIEQATTAASGTPNISAAVTFRIGDGFFSAVGFADDVCVFSRAPSAGEVMSRYLDSRQGSPDTLNWVPTPSGLVVPGGRLHRVSALTGLGGTGQQCFNPTLTGV